mmetsp:Transcript_3063/g.9335  ORF Transcript_3063/g.9335 Transcript_3063/m.9335 type:complete len:89 (-) Transcript_3063:495-761(-)
MALVASRLYANLQSENHTQMALGALLRTRGTEYFLSLMLSLPCPFERQILLTLVNSFLMQVSCSAAVIPESRGYPHINSVHPRQDLHW